eukprot:COSAG06_NODE_2301_length_7120_cov_3.535251_7_plen_194_part_00
MPDGTVRKKRSFWCAALCYPKERSFTKTGSGQTQETMHKRDTFLQVATAVSVDGKDGSGAANDASTRLFAAAGAFSSAGAARSARVATATAAAAAEKTIGGGGGLQPHEVMKLRRAGLAVPGEAPTGTGTATDANAGGGNAEVEGSQSANGKKKKKKTKEKKGSKWAKVRKTPLFEQFVYTNDHFTKTGSGQT